MASVALLRRVTVSAANSEAVACLNHRAAAVLIAFLF